MGQYTSNAGLFLIQTLFGLYILTLMLRFLLQWVRADFYNPLVQAVVTLTNPPLRPLRRVIPGLMGLDMACVLLMLVLKGLELGLVFGLQGHSPAVAGLLDHHHPGADELGEPRPAPAGGSPRLPADRAAAAPRAWPHPAAIGAGSVADRGANPAATDQDAADRTHLERRSWVDLNWIAWRFDVPRIPHLYGDIAYNL